jgi:hypothetical protein
MSSAGGVEVEIIAAPSSSTTVLLQAEVPINTGQQQYSNQILAFSPLLRSKQ